MVASLFVRSKSEVKMPFFAVIFKETILRILLIHHIILKKTFLYMSMIFEIKKKMTEQ